VDALQPCRRGSTAPVRGAGLRAQGRIGQWLKMLGRIDVLILDAFGLLPMSPSHQPLLLEPLEDRHQRGSVLVTSQLPIKLWHGQFLALALADAILDRLVHNAQIFEPTGESMFKKNQHITLTE
jgi:DNA replication protein DnaC